MSNSNDIRANYMDAIHSRNIVSTLGALVMLAAATAAHADMGRTDGSWGVSPSGAATYSIPIWVQPGPMGMQPPLAFVYNSQGGNGTMGVGWSLAGFSAIDRCPSTISQDGAEKAVNMTSTDRFCMSGNKLRITSGPVSSYGSTGAVYQTSMAEFSRITSVGTAGTGPQSFLVHTKSGQILEFGNTADSRVVLSTGATVFRWMLNKVSDRDGNSYAFTYTADNATGRIPLTVSWGPTTVAGSTYQYQATFAYSNKANARDWVSGRQGTNSVVTKQRLDSVTIGYSASGSSYATRRQYQLAYALSPTTGATRLTSITECATSTSNCLKPTSIGYQNGAQGVSSTATSVPSVGGASANRFDFNGDGRNDLAYLSGTWRVAFSTGAGFTAPVDTGVSAAQPQIGRFVSTHVDGFLANVGGTWSYTGYNGGSFTTTSTGTPVFAGSNSVATDSNGDGLLDIIYPTTGTVGPDWYGYIYGRFNTTAGSATVPSFSSPLYTAMSTGLGKFGGNIGIIPYSTCPTERQCDINGDGAGDLNVVLTTTFNCTGGMGGCTPIDTGYDMVSVGGGGYALANSGSGARAPYFGIRFNNDRCIDTIRFNTTTLKVNSCGGGAPATVNLPAAFLTFLDWDGDGKTDIVVNSGGTLGVYKSTGSIPTPFQALITTSIPYNSGCSYYALDVEGDGLDELVCVSSSGVIYYNHNGSGSVGSAGGTNVFATQIPDLVSSITDGYGLTVSPFYVSTAQSNYTKGTGTTLPLVDATDPIIVVGRMRVSDGIGATYDLDYTYKGARRNSLLGSSSGGGGIGDSPIGRRIDWVGETPDESVGTDESGGSSRESFAPDGQWAGFEEITAVDNRNGIKQRTAYEQLFPLVGLIRKSEAFQSDGTPISTITNTSLVETLDPTVNNQRYFTYLSQSASDSYEVGGVLNGQLIASATSTFGYSSFTYGNLTTLTTVVTDKDSTSTPSRYNSTWTRTITNSYEPALASGTDWCVGFVNQTQVAQSSTASGVNPVTRSVAFTPDSSNPTKCRIKTRTVEPSSAQYKVVETYGFDAFGNVNSVQLVGRQPLGGGAYGDMPARTASFDWGATGQFAVSSTDPSGAVSTFAYNAEDATLKEAFDPNSTASNVIKTSFLYDGFARPTRATRPDGTYTTWSYDDCATTGCVYPTHKMTVTETDYDDLNSVITDRYSYKDAFGRTFVSRTRLLNGTTWNGAYQWAENQFDAMGRVYKAFMPCTTASATSSCRLYSVTNSYDALNRVTQTSRPRSQSDSNPQLTTYTYAGRAETVTDALGKTTTRITNVDSSLRQLKDANNYALNFAYDAAGTLMGITDSQSTTKLSLVTVNYGIRPLLVAATDSALGQYTQTFNSLGELIGWTDAKGQSFSATYDSLSRPLTRYEPNAATSTTWEWGNSAAEFNKGRLRHVESTENGETYVENYAYDNRARLRKQSSVIPTQGTFDYDYAYDPHKGWLDTLTYPTSTAGYRLALKYAYQNGAVQSVSDANAPTTVFWTANSSNAWGQLTQETLGNNIVTSKAFDAVTARLASIQSGPSGNPTSIQNLSYLYDLVGNVTQRQNNKLGLTETFYYGGPGDSLHRLEHSALNNGATTASNLALTYDPSGNILSKSQPVDEPLLSQSIAWTSYNYPAQIMSGGQVASFAYGPGRRRWRMAFTSGGNTETTYYIGGLLEKVAIGATESYRHTIVGGSGATVAIYNRPSSGSAVLRYLLSDQQGSTESFVESGTGTVTNASFTAFGLRRNASTWSGDPANRAALDDITRQGYTYQTALGSMGLNHMNGRVQDAASGRFLSADPFITQPGYTQNYNRYSYVYNNPLTYTDPSGFGITVGGGADNAGMYDCRGNGSACADAAAAAANEQHQREEQEHRDAGGRGDRTPGGGQDPKPDPKPDPDPEDPPFIVPPEIVLEMPVLPKFTECNLQADALFDEPGEGQEDREHRADAALGADLAGHTTAGLAEAFRDDLSHRLGRPPGNLRDPIPTGLGPMAPTGLSKYAFMSRLTTYSETLGYMGRGVGGLGAGFDYANSYVNFSNGNNIQGTLDGMSGSLGLLMVVQPETIPVALPALGLVKSYKPLARAKQMELCMNDYQIGDPYMN